MMNPGDTRLAVNLSITPKKPHVCGAFVICVFVIFDASSPVFAVITFGPGWRYCTMPLNSGGVGTSQQYPDAILSAHLMDMEQPSGPKWPGVSRHGRAMDVMPVFLPVSEPVSGPIFEPFF